MIGHFVFVASHIYDESILNKLDSRCCQQLYILFVFLILNDPWRRHRMVLTFAALHIILAGFRKRSTP